jgi:hypothetical protein
MHRTVQSKPCIAAVDGLKQPFRTAIWMGKVPSVCDFLLIFCDESGCDSLSNSRSENSSASCITIFQHIDNAHCHRAAREYRFGVGAKHQEHITY